MDTGPIPAELARSPAAKEPVFWLNPHWQPLAQARVELAVSRADVEEASQRLERFAPLLEQLFPELVASRGIIESALIPVPRLQQALSGRLRGRWLVKADHALAVSGSIKARGGFYEVLLHAERLALSHGLIWVGDDRRVLGLLEARALFAQHEVAVGSTGNLGLSVGIMAAALGFKATVRMSQEAKEWKKTRLRPAGSLSSSTPATSASRSPRAVNSRAATVGKIRDGSSSQFGLWNVTRAALRSGHKGNGGEILECDTSSGPPVKD